MECLPELCFQGIDFAGESFLTFKHIFAFALCLSLLRFLFLHLLFGLVQIALDDLHSAVELQHTKIH